MKLRTYIIIVALCIGIPLTAFLFQLRSSSSFAQVPPGATDRFQTELQDCWDYNRTLYQSERRKIERGTDAPGNPKVTRVDSLEKWYRYEQDACQQFYRGRLNTT